jgi:hypothetical protein
LAHGANVDEGNFEPPRSGGWPVLKRVAWMLGLGLCLLSCVVTLAFAAGSLLDPASSIYAMWSSFAWPLLGPQLTVLTLVCLLVAVVAARRGPRILGWTSLCVAAIALLSSAVITGRIIAATSAAGGSANPFSGLWLHTLNAKPDSTITFEEVDGQKLSAVVYKPSGSTALAPVIMYIHGGGWIQGSAANLGHDMRWSTCTTNPIECTFATVRLSTKITKGPGAHAAGLAMACSRWDGVSAWGELRRLVHWLLQR